jgi:hypothetical protein
LPPALNIIALAIFAASLSARTLDPVPPQVANEFGVSIVTAASFAAAFAFTYAIVQPAIGAARLMTGCLVLLDHVYICRGGPARRRINRRTAKTTGSVLRINLMTHSGVPK